MIIKYDGHDVGRVSEHFTVAELSFSATLVVHNLKHPRNRWNNTPTDEIRENLVLLAQMLEHIRYYIDRPIRINSGYRCPMLNRAVGGSTTSLHVRGLAADIFCSSFRDMMDMAFFAASFEYAREVLCSWNKNDSFWLHISRYRPDEKIGKTTLGFDILGKIYPILTR